MEPQTAPVLVLFGVFGAAVGSFLNVVAYRVPLGRSLVRPGSRCPACEVPVRARDNVPVLSYLLLRGRCRACGVRISARYPLVELATVVLFVAAAWQFPTLEEAAFVALAGASLLALTAIDLEYRRLPNVIVLPSTVAALVWVGAVAAAEGEPSILVEAVAASAAAFVLFLVIALVSGGMGFGDVKLAAFIGLVSGRFGWPVTVLAVFLAFVFGGLVAIALLITRRAGRKQAIPFGPAMALGAVVALFWGEGPVRAWLGL